MKQSSYKGKSPLPDFVIDAACAGNAEAVERVLQHYDGYINKLCTRTLYDGSGQPHICIDEYMKRRLQNKLIHSIVSHWRLTVKAPAIDRRLSLSPLACFPGGPFAP